MGTKFEVLREHKKNARQDTSFIEVLRVVLRSLVQQWRATDSQLFKQKRSKECKFLTDKISIIQTDKPLQDTETSWDCINIKQQHVAMKISHVKVNILNSLSSLFAGRLAHILWTGMYRDSWRIISLIVEASIGCLVGELGGVFPW